MYLAMYEHMYVVTVAYSWLQSVPASLISASKGLLISKFLPNMLIVTFPDCGIILGLKSVMMTS